MGDEEFEKKCVIHLMQAISTGRAAIVVSHNMGLIRLLSSHIAWLEDGRISIIDLTESDILRRYEESVVQ